MEQTITSAALVKTDGPLIQHHFSTATSLDPNMTAETSTGLMLKTHALCATAQIKSQ
jgi:hypothetical protein